MTEGIRMTTLNDVMDELRSALRLAQRVRVAQKAYFKERTKEALLTSKVLEKDLDEKLAELRGRGQL